MEILTLKTKRNEIDYFSFGEGKKNFIIIPGLSLKSVMLSADGVAWAYDIFRKDYTTYVFDRARHIENGYTVEDMADDIADAMMELGISDAYVFGASQGGMIAQILAIKHPNLVKKMVLGSSASRLGENAKALLKRWVTFAKKGDVVNLNHSIFVNLYSDKMLYSLGDFLDELEKDGTAEEMERFSILANACLGFDAYDLLYKVKCKTLVIGARYDSVLGCQASVEMAEKVNAELYLYDAGHAVYDEAPDYKQRIIDFFENE